MCRRPATEEDRKRAAHARGIWEDHFDQIGAELNPDLPAETRATVVKVIKSDHYRKMAQKRWSKPVSEEEKRQRVRASLERKLARVQDELERVAVAT